MSPANILLAVDLMMALSRKFIAYREAIATARAQSRDLTDSELDALADAAEQTLLLNKQRLESMKP